MLETIQGIELVELVIEQIKPLSEQILIVTSQKQSTLMPSYPADVIVDIYPNKGPLGGIYTGLLASKFSRSLVVACDMPFLNIDLLKYMIELSPNFDATVVRLEEDKLESLHAIYSRNCLDTIKAMLDNNQLKISTLFGKINTRYVERAECQKFDRELLTFFNINNQQDIDKATQIISKAKVSRAE